MKYLVFWIFLFLFGFWIKSEKELPFCNVSEETPITSRKSFVFVVYAHNDALWVERSLRSLLEQEYDQYRVIFIDDGSVDATFKVAQNFISENNQSSKVLWIHNEKKEGFIPCLYHVTSSLLDQEIVIPIHGRDWLSHSGVLTKMNQAYQNPDTWGALSSAILFPSYKKHEEGLKSFYAALFKGLSLETLHQMKEESYIKPLHKTSEGRMKLLNDVLIVSNQT
jgi:glycosyltransferase involved in cell wall biosynthesis